MASFDTSATLAGSATATGQLRSDPSHAGHAGARKGGGHYNVTIVSAAFENKTLVQRHQLIYAALGDMMKEEIHALGINALTPTEENKG